MEKDWLIISFVVAYIYNGYTMITLLKNGPRSEQPQVIFSSNVISKFLFSLRWPFVFSYEEESLYIKRSTFRIYGLLKFIFTMVIHTIALYYMYILSSMIEDSFLSWLAKVIGFLIYVFIMPLVYIFFAKTILFPLFMLLSYFDKK